MREERPEVMRSKGSKVALAAAAAAVLGIVGALVGATAANAYTWSGCRWFASSLNITHWTSGLYYTASSQAAAQWSSATDLTLTEASTTTAYTIGTNHNTGAAVGTIDRECSGIGQILSVHIYSNTYYLASDTAFAKRAVVAHEMGHGFGLTHTNAAVLMYPTLAGLKQMGINTAQPDDIAGVNANY